MIKRLLVDSDLTFNHKAKRVSESMGVDYGEAYKLALKHYRKKPSQIIEEILLTDKGSFKEKILAVYLAGLISGIGKKTLTIITKGQ